GLRVVARGKISVYEPKGEYQLVCEHLEPHGLGALQLAFDQLKKRLQQEGLFDAARKRPLPALPRKIGIVTSLDGAAIRDIIKVLRRRYANAHLVICPARVQGEDAAPDIARALGQIARVPGVDVVIVGRRARARPGTEPSRPHHHRSAVVRRISRSRGDAGPPRGGAVPCARARHARPPGGARAAPPAARAATDDVRSGAAARGDSDATR